MKKIIKIVAFLCVTVILFLAVNSALCFKYAEGIRQMERFYEEEENTIDVLVLGSSHAFFDIYPEVLWEEYGYSSYILGSGIQPLWFSYYYLVEALKTQTPKMIILEGYRLVEEKDYVSRATAIRNLYGMKWSKNKWDAIRTSIPTAGEEDTEKLRDVPLEFMNYHSRYADLSESDFLDDYGSAEYRYYKGAICETRVYSNPTVPDVESYSQTPHALSEKTEEFYRKMLELATEKGIPMMTVIAPYRLSEKAYTMFCAAEQISAEYGQPFIDYNRRYEEINFDFSVDMLDKEGHLNKSGAEKFTSALGKYISENYMLPDHRGDCVYESWELATKAYHRLYEDGDMKIKKKPSAYVEQGLKNGDYTFVITVNTPVNAAEEYFVQVKKMFEKLGIPLENGELCDGVWIVTNGTLEYCNTSQKEFKKNHRFDRQMDIQVSYGVPNVEGWSEKIQDGTVSVRKEQVFYFTDDEQKATAAEGVLIYTYDTWLSDYVNTYHYALKDKS